jgi:hypothetical protein
MPHPVRKIVDAKPLDGFRVALRFDDGKSKTVDLEALLHGPVFEDVRGNPQAFRAFKIDGGTLTWPNGADIDPLVLYYDDLKPAWSH